MLPFLIWYRTSYVSALCNMICGSLNPTYLLVIYSTMVPKLTCNNLIHYFHYYIPSLCATHHLVGVSFNTTSNTKNILCSGIYNSKSFTKEFMSLKPSYLGGTHDSIPIHHNYRVMWVHRLVDTSCILCF
jgi:hypothetical protein